VRRRAAGAGQRVFGELHVEQGGGAQPELAAPALQRLGVQPHGLGRQRVFEPSISATTTPRCGHRLIEAVQRASASPPRPLIPLRFADGGVETGIANCVAQMDHSSTSQRTRCCPLSKN